MAAIAKPVTLSLGTCVATGQQVSPREILNVPQIGCFIRDDGTVDDKIRGRRRIVDEAVTSAVLAAAAVLVEED